MLSSFTSLTGTAALVALFGSIADAAHVQYWKEDKYKGDSKQIEALMGTCYKVALPAAGNNPQSGFGTGSIIPEEGLSVRIWRNDDCSGSNTSVREGGWETWGGYMGAWVYKSFMVKATGTSDDYGEW